MPRSWLLSSTPEDPAVALGAERADDVAMERGAVEQFGVGAVDEEDRAVPLGGGDGVGDDDKGAASLGQGVLDDAAAQRDRRWF
jgi:hypothetical protein